MPRLLPPKSRLERFFRNRLACAIVVSVPCFMASPIQGAQRLYKMGYGWRKVSGVRLLRDV